MAPKSGSSDNRIAEKVLLHFKSFFDADLVPGEFFDLDALVLDQRRISDDVILWVQTARLGEIRGLR